MTLWITRDGRVMDMSEMTDIHLQNAIRQLLGGLWWHGYRAQSYFQTSQSCHIAGHLYVLPWPPRVAS